MEGAGARNHGLLGGRCDDLRDSRSVWTGEKAARAFVACACASMTSVVGCVGWAFSTMLLGTPDREVAVVLGSRVSAELSSDLSKHH